MEKINVCVAEDHHFVRAAMVRLLQSFERIGIVQDVSNGADLLKVLNSSPVDIAIIDLDMPVMDGLEAAKRIRLDFPFVKMIVLTMHDDTERVSQLLKAGVHGYLLKKADPAEVQHAIYAVADRGFYCNDLVSEVLRTKPPLEEKHKCECSLSETELKILVLLCEDHNPKDIGNQLGLSEKTVHAHKRTIMQKTGSSGIASLLRYGISHGLIREGLSR